MKKSLYLLVSLAILFSVGRFAESRVTTADSTDIRCDGPSGAEVCIDSSGNLLPTTDNDTTLGTSSLRWATAYILDITVGDDLTVTDDASVAGELGVGDTTPDAKFEVQSDGGGETYSLLISSDNGSTNEIAFDTANDELEITANVAIGGDTSGDAMLEVVSEGAGETYALLVSSNNGSTNEVAFDGVNDDLEISAKVGIGADAATPDAQLEVTSNGGGETYALLVSSNNGSTNEIALDTAGDELEILADVCVGMTSCSAGVSIALPTTQVIGAGGTIAADACGGLKLISSAAGVTTDTTNTFTAPAAGNAGCCMRIVNVNASDTITLDNNANFVSAGAADVVVGANDAVEVCSSGASGKWYQTSALLAN